MSLSVKCRKASHSNVVVENLERSVQHLEAVFGASFMLDLPGENWHACLIEVGGFIMELFEPKHFLLHGRIGPHYLGIEFEADVDQARAACAAHGIGITRDIGQAIHTEPRDGFGVDYEFFDGSFYGPEAAHVKTRTRGAQYWAEQPVGFAGFLGYSHAVADAAAASAFLQAFLCAKPLGEEACPALGARLFALQIADARVELLSPAGAGELLDAMLLQGQGMRSTLYAVSDIGRARAWFEEKGLRVIAGSVPGSIAVDPRDNLGILFEFRQRQSLPANTTEEQV